MTLKVVKLALSLSNTQLFLILGSPLSRSVAPLLQLVLEDSHSGFKP
jgi:hypothetical protein